MIQGFDIEAKIVLRKKYYVVYLKEGSGIVDLLNVCEAPIALMKLENLRIVKEMRNSVNRRVNCETANITKTVTAATRQIEDIIYIRDHYGLENLPSLKPDGRGQAGESGRSAEGTGRVSWIRRWENPV